MYSLDCIVTVVLVRELVGSYTLNYSVEMVLVGRLIFDYNYEIDPVERRVYLYYDLLLTYLTIVSCNNRDEKLMLAQIVVFEIVYDCTYKIACYI